MTITPCKAKTRPYEVEAVQYNPGIYTKGEWLSWCPALNIGVADSSYEAGLESFDFRWFVLGGETVEPRGWIVKIPDKSEFFYLDPQAFNDRFFITEVEGMKVITFDGNFNSGSARR